jgi:hypothetical protein
MEKTGKQRVWRALACLLCVAVLWARLDTIGSGEFAGGGLTGTLFTLAEFSSLLFLIALVLAFFLRRIAATIALMAAILCFPLYLYFLIPGLYRWIFRGEYSVPIEGLLHWDTWAVAGVLSLLFATILSVRSYSSVTQTKDKLLTNGIMGN